MARKAVRGYTEKSYYDNTTFKGIVATTDPLNEGSFAHMVNFDISDTGSSVKPRCGFLTTDFVIKEGQSYNTVKLKADSTLYFYEPSLQQYIFVDFSTFKFTSEELGDYTYSVNAYTVSFNAETVEGHTNKHFVATRITNVDIDDIINIFPHDNEDDYKNIRLYLTKIAFKDSNARYITDEYLISKYLIKHTFPDFIPYSWIELYYRKKGSTYNDITYSDDTVVLSYVDTEDVVSIDPTKRNIASKKNVIPEIMQKIYPSDSTEILYNQFPMIYVKDNNTGKYLMSSSIDSNVTFIPHFLLKDVSTSETNTSWVYTYKFASTSAYADIYGDEVYNSGIYSLKDNKPLDSIWADAFVKELGSYSDKVYADSNIQLHYYAEKTYYNHIDSMYFYYLYYLRFFATENGNLHWADSIRSGFLPVSTERQEHNDAYGTTDFINNGEDMFRDSALAYYIKTINAKTYNYFTNNNFKNSVLIYVLPKAPTLMPTIDTMPAQCQLSDFLRTLFSKCTKDYINTYNSDEEEIEKLNSIRSSSIQDLIRVLDDSVYGKYRFLIIPVKDINKKYTLDINMWEDVENGFFEYEHFSFFTGILALDDNPDIIHTRHDVVKYLTDNAVTNVIFKFMRTSYAVKIDKSLSFKFWDDMRAYQFLPGIDRFKNAREYDRNYYIYMADVPIFDSNGVPSIGNIDLNPNSGSNLIATDMYKGYFYKTTESYIDSAGNRVTWDNMSSIPILSPLVINPDRTGSPSYGFDTRLWGVHSIKITDEVSKDESHFSISNGLLQLNMGDAPLIDLYRKNYFVNGINLTMALTPIYTPKKFLDILDINVLKFTSDSIMSSTNLWMSRPLIYTSDPQVYKEQLEEEPNQIKNSTTWCIFHSEQGDRLVVWSGNRVYMSEPNMYYYFTEACVYNYPEKVLKVIQFKNTLLVFTTINLYSIYPYEDVTQSTGVDEEGNPTTIQTKTIMYATLPVLYNLMLTEQYIDAIQVFNQMVLFYSADGQLFMIKPTATIDNDTKFTIQYFNKSANDILANYDTYMNERLQVYGYSGDYLISDKTNVGIKVQVNINYIKIFYMYKDYTYILIYDVINNYYYAYDTMSFSDIKDIFFTEEGDVYVNTTFLGDDKKYLFFTIKNSRPNEVDNNIDEAIYNNFVNYDILTELDTGVLNLNTHLKKRFRDLHTVYKNITATYLNMEVETFIDCVPAQVVFSDSIEVKSNTLDGTIEHVYDCVKVKNTNDILKQNALFDFSLFASNKMLTHYTNIPCLGKQFRLRLRLNSKGVYKLQSYGITFKEHQI